MCVAQFHHSQVLLFKHKSIPFKKSLYSHRIDRRRFSLSLLFSFEFQENKTHENGSNMYNLT